MADIRINALATTATSSASDDYVAIDGAANGTRKLSAYSPTFGGNVTVSGTSDTTGNATIGTASGGITGKLTLGNGVGGNSAVVLRGGSTQKAWQLGSNINNADSLEFSPSTAGGGTTFSTTVWRVDGSGNSTQSGNLTVSGTGNSSFAGNLLVTNSKFSFWDTGDQATNGYLEAGHFSNGAFIGTVAGTNAAADLVRFGTSGTERMRLNSSGNLLIAATVDSGNGKLQLATHTTSAGGIGFGTVASLYTDGNNGYIALAPPSGTTAGYRLYNSTTLRGQLAYSGTDVYLDASTGSLILRTGSSTTALTLDSSQNATFAKTVTAQSSDNATAGVVVKSADQVAIANWICDSTASSSIRNWSITTNGSSYGDLEFRSSNARGGNPVSAGTKVFSINSSGAISIGNTVTAAASVASTHKVTISIGGVTYYLLASNV